MTNNPIAAFREALASAGVVLAASTQIIPDGKLHRARAADDKPGRLSIWYNFHPDAPASGAAGNWRTGARLTWCSKRMTALSATERAIIRERIERDRKQHEAEKRARYRNAAERAARIWAASTPADAMHPYLQRKQIAPGIARQNGSALVLPVVDFDGALHGLQFIQPDGSKRFLPGMSKAGHFIPIDKIPDDATRALYVSEGYATAATLAAMKLNACHIAACDCGNLQSVALEARRRFPQIDLVIAPDFDLIGQQKGRDAAIASRAKILPMPANIPDGCTDWNDVQAAKRQGVKHG